MTVALIVAAGSGERLGVGQPKALVQVAGRPLLAWSIDALLATAGVERIVIATPPGAAVPAELVADARVSTVDGGASRSESVRRAFDAASSAGDAGGARDAAGAVASGPDDLVLVHDAARPLLTPALAESVIAALAHDLDADAAIAAMPVTDTVKRVDAQGAVQESLDRSELWAVQTPQVFRRAALQRALDVPAEQLARATDDAGLIERDGGRVIVVRASDQNLKVTTPLDLRVAELLLGGWEPS
ncbi:MAG TPA: 2-C-methyl-D-erythritol 4-phosphate cytidylyltransferase [Solirubrobacteraceae bacterium]|jgi:2-C-methyl-D-erythritol 4-phosphate cytidylyltransferase|nr:2-C-methyl-D-erythritol 4-phosphate cytidylyltransferase [Solirubrobacteraceae bacterium]